MDPLTALGSVVVLIAVVLIWLGPSLFVGWLADGRGRSSLGWSLLAFFATPLVAGLLLFLLPPEGPRHDV